MTARRETQGQKPPSKKRFATVPNAPPPWTWDQYSHWLRVEWAELLRTGDSSKEEPYRQFLERHPCLIPGGEGTGDSFGGHHGSWSGAVISQPRLPGITRRIPDFMWLTKNSEDIIPVLVELEAPGKAWFNQDGRRSAKLTQAQDQLAEWQQQLDNPANRQLLGELYNFPRRWTFDYNLVPRLLLIYGRQEEFRLRPWLSQKRRATRSPATEAMTFDRIKPLAGSRNAFSVRVAKTSQVVIAVPPTFRLGPSIAEAIATIQGWERAIASNDLMTQARKDFLLSRVPYWIEIGRSRLQGERPEPHDERDWE
jgi:hypothetical protein